MRKYRYGQVLLSTTIISWAQAPPPPLTDSIFISPTVADISSEHRCTCLPDCSLLIYTYVLEGVMESMQSHLQLFVHGTTQVFAVV